MGWTPYFKKRSTKGAKLEFANIGTIFFGGLGYVCMLVTLWLPEIIRFLYLAVPIGERFWGCESVVNLILIGYFFFGCYLIQLPGIYIKNLTNGCQYLNCRRISSYFVFFDFDPKIWYQWSCIFYYYSFLFNECFNISKIKNIFNTI